MKNWQNVAAETFCEGNVMPYARGTSEWAGLSIG